MNKLDIRLDAAGRYISNLSVATVPDCRAIQSTPHLGWVATLVTDRIGDASMTFVRYAESPSEAIEKAITAAGSWAARGE